MQIELNNVFYFSNINVIGGVESFFYYLTKKYNDYDITILYKTGDILQVKRLQKNCIVKKYNGEKIKCKKAFFNYTKDIIDNIEADEYIEIIHRDPKAIGEPWKIHDKITKYIGVSQLVCDHFKEVTGKDCQLIYIPVDIEKPKKVLRLISATRLTAEKGRDRMIKFANMLQSANIPFIWTIFTDSTNIINNPFMIFMKPTLDILPYIANSDYLVQLSNDESFCIAVDESECLGVPVIVTDCPVFKELGIKDGVNGWVVDFDLSNVDVEKIYNTKLTFKYNPPKDTWGDELMKGKPKHRKEKTNLNTLQALENFTYTRFDELKDMVRFDTNSNKKGTIYTGDIFDCDDDIMDFLLNKGEGNKAHRCLCRVLMYKDRE